MQRITLFLITVLSLILRSSSGFCDETIKIGVVYAFTGVGQQWSDYGRMGLELARDEINLSGGINGKKIELVFEDSQTEPAKSVSAYRKLVTVDKVKFVIGNVWSFITNPLIPLAEKDKVILIAPTVMHESVERTNPYFFTMGYKVGGLKSAVDKFFKVNKGIRTVGILCWDDLWGQANLKLWQEVIAENGAQIVQEVCTRDFTGTFAAEITKIRSKKPDAVIIAFHAEKALARMREQHFKAKILSTSNLVEELEAQKTDKSFAEGVYFTDWRPNEEFINNFKLKFNKDPILEAHNSYEALRSIARALSSGSDDMLAELKKVQYQGVGGEIDFSKGSFANHGFGELYLVRDGKRELVN